jgi:hypothetical protein
VETKRFSFILASKQKIYNYLFGFFQKEQQKAKTGKKNYSKVYSEREAHKGEETPSSPTTALEIVLDGMPIFFKVPLVGTPRAECCRK